MDRIMKTVRQYSIKINAVDFEELKYIAEQYRKVKNYVYSRYSGINGISLLKESRKSIREVWVKESFAEQWHLPARYWKLALEEAIGNIKSKWSAIKNSIKICINKNKSLCEEELHYIRYILKAEELYVKVLLCKAFDTPKKFNEEILRIQYLHSMIRRLTRRYKGKIPYSKKGRTFMVDEGVYRYEKTEDSLFINISSAKKGKRIKVALTDKNIHKGNMNIVLEVEKSRLQIHDGVETVVKENTNSEKIIGIDKGYRFLFAVSSEKFYGEGLNHILSKETERLNTVNAKRNRFHALYKKYVEQGNFKKAGTIKENNLGKVKYNSHKEKNDQRVKSYINFSLNQLIAEENPTEIVMENLNFVSWEDRYPISVKRKLARWIKGYIRKRAEYKCNLNNILYTYVNPAYTSKICNLCGEFGDRKGDVFICPNCGNLHSDLNASKNILNRKYDKEINLYTPYKKVKEILKDRLKREVVV